MKKNKEPLNALAENPEVGVSIINEEGVRSFNDKCVIKHGNHPEGLGESSPRGLEARMVLYRGSPASGVNNLRSAMDNPESTNSTMGDICTACAAVRTLYKTRHVRLEDKGGRRDI